MDDGDEALVEQAASILSRCRALSNRVSVYCKRSTGETDALAVEVKSLQATIASLRSAAYSASSDEAAHARVAALLRDATNTLQGLGPGGDLRRFCAPRNSALVRLLLGSKVVLVTQRQEQAIAIKEEYHAFRARAVWVMLVVPLALFLGMRRADALRDSASHPTFTLTPPLLTALQLYLVWVTYFYVSMALREGVLLVNGSHINAWWVQHHYWSAGAALLMLALPVSSPTVYYFAENFMLWSAFQAAVMAVQLRYQRRRMYTRIALGKNSALDVVSGESSGSTGQLLLLYPLLFVLQAWQCVLGGQVAFKTWPAIANSAGWLDTEPSQSDLRGMRGTFILGCTLTFLGLMNFYNTALTIPQKRLLSRRASLRRPPSRAALATPGTSAAAAGSAGAPSGGATAAAAVAK